MTHPALRLITKENYDLPAPEVMSEAHRASVRSSEQLSFSFDDVEAQNGHRVEIVAMNSLHGKRLCELIMSSKPKVALDLRHVIRFDLPGTSREQVLSYFRATHTLYLRDPIPWHNLKRRDFIAGNMVISQRLEHETVERKQSPVLLLVPKDEHVSLLTAYLNRVFSKRREGPWEISALH
ncbi:hypothetical protein [Roseovarius nubinhibens]|uniref:hypothetical protein n=1 Tax=Roseovarius nubinhibens TaxID=314263 RepID=UPI0030ECBF9A|tara:strand:- start:12037 stop:12576 length:540 start_codon:yes stop_codon:yes gene_type:complete